MANQVRGTTTNMAKLVSWDIDLFNSMDDNKDCLVLLSRRDKYLLGQALSKMVWATRWTSEVGTQLPNMFAIAGNLELLLSQDNCMDICELIIDCIEDENSGVSTAISNVINNWNYDTGRNAGQSQNGFLLGDGADAGCSKDVWYGGVVNLINALDENNVDALQILEVSTNINEWIASVATGIAGLEVPLLQSMLDWGLFIQDNIAENYDAQWTQEYRETISCEIFCLATEACELTPQMLVDYFYNRLTSQLSFQSLLNETLEFLVLGVWSGTEIVDFMMLSQLAFRAQLGRWFGFIAFNDIDFDIRVGMLHPDPAWSLLCDECIQWCFKWIPRYGEQQGWIFLTGRQIGNRLWSSAGVISPIELSAETSFAPISTADSITLGIVIAHIKPVRHVIIEAKMGGVVVADADFSTFNGQPGVTQEFVLDVAGITFDEIYFRFYSNGSTDINAWLDWITVNGDGVNPLGVSNCEE